MENGARANAPFSFYCQQFDIFKVSRWAWTDREAFWHIFNHLRNVTIENVRKIQGVLEHAIKTNRSLLIIAEDIDNEALATLIVMFMYVAVKVFYIKLKLFFFLRVNIIQFMISI